VLSVFFRVLYLYTYGVACSHNVRLLPIKKTRSFVSLRMTNSMQPVYFKHGRIAMRLSDIMLSPSLCHSEALHFVILRRKPKNLIISAQRRLREAISLDCRVACAPRNDHFVTSLTITFTANNPGLSAFPFPPEKAQHHIFWRDNASWYPPTAAILSSTGHTPRFPPAHGHSAPVDQR